MTSIRLDEHPCHLHDEDRGEYLGPHLNPLSAIMATRRLLPGTYRIDLPPFEDEAGPRPWFRISVEEDRAVVLFAILGCGAAEQPRDGT